MKLAAQVTCSSIWLVTLFRKTKNPPQRQNVWKAATEKTIHVLWPIGLD